MNICDALRLLKAKRDHLSTLSEADKGPGLYSLTRIKQDPQLYAKVFCEGNKQLEKFLLKCFEKGIYTRSCCKGHINFLGQSKKSYITFDDIENNFDQLSLMINNIYQNGELTIEFGSLLDSNEGEFVPKNHITFRFDKKLNKMFYKVLSDSVDVNIHSNHFEIPKELSILYDICFNNNLDFIPDANITLAKDGSYILTFYNALSYLKKTYEDDYSNFYNNFDCEKRLFFNYFLLNQGFKREYFRWYFQSNNKMEIINKLNTIYMMSKYKYGFKEITVNELIYFVNELTTYYNDYYNANFDTRLFCENNQLILTIYMYEKDKSLVVPVYSKKMLYSEELSEQIYTTIIENIINNHNMSDITIAIQDDCTKVKYKNNQVQLDIPNYGSSIVKK